MPNEGEGKPPIPLTDGRLPLQVWVPPGESVEIVLLNEFGSIGGPVRVLGAVPADAFEASGEIAVDVESDDGDDDLGLDGDAATSIRVGQTGG